MLFTSGFLCYGWMLIQASADGNLNGTMAHDVECSAYREVVAKAYAPSQDAGDVNATLNDIGWLMSSNGSCMFVVRRLLSWAEHNQRCESVTGGRLAWLKDRFQMSSDECHRLGSTHCGNDTHLQNMFIGMYRRDDTSICSQKYVWASHNGTCEQNMCTFVHAPAIKPVDVMNVELCATSAYHSAKPEREMIIISEGSAWHHCPDIVQTAGGVQRTNGSSYIHIDEYLVDDSNETIKYWMPHYYIINPSWDCGNHSAICEIIVNATPTCPDPTTVVCPEPPPAATIPAEIEHSKGPGFSSLIETTPASTTPAVKEGGGHTEDPVSSSLTWLWVLLALLGLGVLLCAAFHRLACIEFARKHFSSAGPSEASDAPPSTTATSEQTTSGSNEPTPVVATSEAPAAPPAAATAAAAAEAPGYFPPADHPLLVPVPQ